MESPYRDDKDNQLKNAQFRIRDLEDHMEKLYDRIEKIKKTSWAKKVIEKYVAWKARNFMGVIALESVVAVLLLMSIMVGTVILVSVVCKHDPTYHSVLDKDKVELSCKITCASKYDDTIAAWASEVYEVEGYVRCACLDAHTQKSGRAFTITKDHYSLKLME